MSNRGQASEQLAVEYLQSQRVRILARNLRCKAGELDLVGLDGDVLAVIEVRQRAGTRFGGACASVTRRKQHKIIRAAGYFLQRRMEWRSRVMRFDVFAVEGPPDGPRRMLWLKDAFRAT
jgi:putative endonuclease